jgi:hypothetical protein
MAESIREQYRYIIANFDFEKVHKVMEFLNWEWREQGVPNIPQLKETAMMLLDTVCEKGDGTITATGGFTAELIDGYLELRFCVEEQGSCLDSSQETVFHAVH